jgi:hypothetical protein
MTTRQNNPSADERRSNGGTPSNPPPRDQSDGQVNDNVDAAVPSVPPQYGEDASLGGREELLDLVGVNVPTVGIDGPFIDMHQGTPHAEHHMMSGPVSLVALLNPTMRFHPAEPQFDPAVPEEPLFHHPEGMHWAGIGEERVSQVLQDALLILAEDDLSEDDLSEDDLSEDDLAEDDLAEDDLAEDDLAILQ